MSILKPIDLETWERREYFEFYCAADLPYINIGAHVDVTNLLAVAKRECCSSYLGLVFAAHRTAESIENFHYRIKDGRPFIVDTMRPSFTYMPEGSELFINVVVDFVDDLAAFDARAKAQIAVQGREPGLGVLSGGNLDIISCSGIPWIEYTHIMRIIMRLGVDSNPKMSWGKYFERDGRMLVPFSVQVHHALMDGFHLGRYFERLQEYLDGLAAPRVKGRRYG